MHDILQWLFKMISGLKWLKNFLKGPNKWIHMAAPLHVQDMSLEFV